MHHRWLQICTEGLYIATYGFILRMTTMALLLGMDYNILASSLASFYRKINGMSTSNGRSTSTSSRQTFTP